MQEKKNLDAFGLLYIIQRGITISLFAIFGALLVYGLFAPEPNADRLNAFLPVVSGWIGAIIGFYFSKEISAALENRMRGIKEEVLKQDVALAARVEALQRQISEKDALINQTRDAYRKIKEDAERTIKEIERFYERELGRDARNKYAKRRRR